MSGSLDASNSPGPGGAGDPIGDLEREPEPDRCLHPPAHAGADQPLWGVHRAHTRTPARPFVGVDQQMPSDLGASWEIEGDDAHGRGDAVACALSLRHADDPGDDPEDLELVVGEVDRLHFGVGGL